MSELCYANDLQRPDSFPGFSSRTTSAASAPGADTAQPARRSGLGALLERERQLQVSTRQQLQSADRVDSASFRQVLREQDARLAAVISLLKQRYAAGSENKWPGAADSASSLIEQHEEVLRMVAALIEKRADGQRGALILTEIVRLHEEMLAGLLRPDSHARDLIPLPVTATVVVAGTERQREDGGDASRPATAA